MTMVPAAHVLDLSERQVRGLLERIRTDGAASIRHKAIGRPSNNRISDGVRDYGAAEWKGRRLEAVAIRDPITTKNAIRGECAEPCFVLHYLIDSEFEVHRDPIVGPCGGVSGV